MRLRLIEQRDVDACLSIWPMHGIEHTEAVGALERALSTQRLAGAVIEHPHTQERLGFGVSAFVRGATLDEAAAAGVPLVEHVLRAEAAGSSRLLTPDMTPQAGRALDLHLLVLAYRQRSFDMDDPQARELLQVGHTAYRLMHEGYPLRGVWQEGEPSDADWMGAGGYLVKRHYRANGAAGRILFGTLREDVTPAWPSHTVWLPVPWPGGAAAPDADAAPGGDAGPVEPQRCAGRAAPGHLRRDRAAPLARHLRAHRRRVPGAAGRPPAR